jgi:hypothetical protein
VQADRRLRSIHARPRRAEGDAQLQLALAFYRQVAATGYLRKAEALITQSA